GAPAYWPWVQALRGYVRDADAEELRRQLGAGAADVAQILPDLRDRFPELAAPSPADAEGARFRLFDATAQFLRNAAHARPLLLVLDDLHAADTPSLLLLQFAARELGDSRLLVLGALRDVDPVPNASLKATLGELAREAVTRRLTLTGLSSPAVAEYVELAAGELGSSMLVEQLYEETGGNPLFLSETVRLLALEGLQHDRPERPVAIPESVRDVIGRRVGHLSDECRRVLELASVLGREFGQAELAAMRGAGATDVIDVPGVPGRLRFAHVLVRDTIYEGLTTARRVLLHRLAVDALEKLYGDEP